MSDSTETLVQFHQKNWKWHIPMKLYKSFPGAESASGSHIRGEKIINLMLEEADILAGQSRTPEFLAKNSSGGVVSWWLLEMSANDPKRTFGPADRCNAK